MMKSAATVCLLYCCRNEAATMSRSSPLAERVASRLPEKKSDGNGKARTGLLRNPCRPPRCDVAQNSPSARLCFRFQQCQRAAFQGLEFEGLRKLPSLSSPCIMNATLKKPHRRVNTYGPSLRCHCPLVCSFPCTPLRRIVTSKKLER